MQLDWISYPDTHLMLRPIANAAVDPLLASEVSPAGQLNFDEMLRSLMDINIVKQTTETEVVPTSPADRIDKFGAHTSDRILTLTDLPPELLRLILYDVAVGSRSNRRLLLGVCFQWRDILINTPHLWTGLYVNVAWWRDTTDTFERLLWRLDLHLQRCGSLMLDVYWGYSLPSDQTSELFAFLRERAPFSRWRSLELGYTHVVWPLEDEMFIGMGDFRSLASLKISSYISDRLLRRINDSVTSKLIHVEFETSNVTLSQFNNWMSSILRYTSAIQLPRFRDNPIVALPPNIKEITTSTLPHGIYPYVTSLTSTDWADNRQYDNRYFPNLEYLSTTFMNSRGVPTVLTSLITLVVTRGTFRPLAMMKLPNLRVLRIGNADPYGGRYSYRPEIKNLRATVMEQSMSLNPTDTLEIKLPLPVDLLKLIIKKMGGKTRELVLWVDETYGGWEMLRALIISPPTPVSYPSLTSLFSGLARLGKGPPERSEPTLPHGTARRRRIAPRLETFVIRTRFVYTEEDEKVWRAILTRVLLEDEALQVAKILWMGGVTTNVARTDVSL